MGYQCFGVPCCIHLQAEVKGTGEKGCRYRPGGQEGRSSAANRKWEVGKDSETSGRRGASWYVQPATAGIKMLVGSQSPC